MGVHGKPRRDSHSAALRLLGMLLVLLAVAVICAVSLMVYLHFDQGLFNSPTRSAWALATGANGPPNGARERPLAQRVCLPGHVGWFAGGGQLRVGWRSHGPRAAGTA